MANDLKRVGVSRRKITQARPHEFFNVSFLPSDVQLRDPMDEIPNELHNKLKRYRLIGPIKEEPTTRLARRRPRAPTLQTEPSKATLETRRRAIQATTVDLSHTRVQNALFEHLKAQGEFVTYEEDHIDLVVRARGKETLVEIKTDRTVRGCLRSALGQILDYALHGEHRPAGKLVIVGDALPTTEDLDYLRFLRRQHGLPLAYWRFLPSEGSLTEYDG